MKYIPLLLSLLAAATAPAQYAQLTTNLFAPGAGGVTAEAEVPVAPRLALEFSAGRIFFGQGSGSLWSVDEVDGHRLGAVAKVYQRQASGLQEGLFVGPYLRYSDVEVHEHSGAWFGGDDDPYRLRKLVVGGLLGLTSVGDRGFAASLAGGIGYTFSRRYSCLPGLRDPDDLDCGQASPPLRDADLHLYLQASLGYRLYTGRAKLLKAEAELVEEERRWLARERRRVQAEAAPESVERPAGMSDVEWRRLRHKLRWRARQRKGY